MQGAAAPEVLFFDIGGTLLNFSIEPSALFAKILAAQGTHVEPKALYRIMRSVEADFPLPLGVAAGSEAAYWRVYDERILARAGVEPTPDLVGEINRRFRAELTLDCFPESLEVLREVKALGLPLGVISNASHGILGDIERNGLAPFFDHVVYSQAVGASKPDPRIFREALERFGVAAQRTWHIGDSVEADVEGAKGVGIQPVLVDRLGQFGAVAAPRVKDLRGVVAMLEEA